MAQDRHTRIERPGKVTRPTDATAGYAHRRASAVSAVGEPSHRPDVGQLGVVVYPLEAFTGEMRTKDRSDVPSFGPKTSGGVGSPGARHADPARPTVRHLEGPAVPPSPVARTLARTVA